MSVKDIIEGFFMAVGILVILKTVVEYLAKRFG